MKDLAEHVSSEDEVLEYGNRKKACSCRIQKMIHFVYC